MIKTAMIEIMYNNHCSGSNATHLRQTPKSRKTKKTVLTKRTFRTYFP